MRRILSYGLVLFAALAFCACNEDATSVQVVNDVPDVAYSTKCQMTKLYVQLAEAPSYEEADYYIQCSQKGSQFSAINQKGKSLQSVPIKFEISNKAKLMQIDESGEQVLQDSLISTVSTLDLSAGTVYLKVLAQDKETFSLYTLDITSY